MFMMDPLPPSPFSFFFVIMSLWGPYFGLISFMYVL